MLVEPLRVIQDVNLLVILIVDVIILDGQP